jgi:hypothetical protein
MALPLSSIASGIRNIGSAFSRTNVSSTAIRGTQPLTRNEFVQQSQQFAQNQQKNQAAIGGIQQQFQGLQQQITVLANGINNVAKLIQQDTTSEQQLLNKQQQEEKVFTTRKIRRGRESELEQRIESAVMAPVQAAAAKTQDIFGRVGRALQIMFFGFLGVQALKMLKALREGDENLLQQIKDLILRNIGYALAALAAVKIGLPLIGLALRTLVTKVVGFLFKGISSILKSAVTKAGQFMGSIASKVIPGLGGSTKAAGAGTKLAQEGAEAAAKGGARTAAAGFGKSAAKTAGRGILGSLPFVGTALDTWGAAEELSKGNLTGAGLYAAGAVTSLIPGMQLVSGGLSVAALGQSLTYNPEEEKKKKEQSPQSQSQPQSTPKSTATSTTPTPSSPPKASTPPIAMPTTPALPNLNMPKMGEEKEEEGSTSPKPIQGIITPIEDKDKKNKKTENVSSSPSPSVQINQNIPESSPQTSMLPTKSDLSISPSANGAVKQDPDYLMAESEMWGAIADGLEMGLSYEELGMDQAQIDYVEGKTKNIPYLVDQMGIESAGLIETPQKKLPQIKPLEEPSPNVVVTAPQPSGSQQEPQTQMPQSDIPFIPSANPDNFYVLYSKLNYNVTM